MSTGIVFDRETSQRMSAVYQTGDVVRRRQWVMDALQLQRGEHVIDIGTGPGFLAAQISDAVGPTGRVHGIDVSEPMLQLAEVRCAGRTGVKFLRGEATQLPVPDATFDAAVSVQVFEYIAEVDAAIREALRVLKPGGRAVIVATDWDSMLWHSEDPERMRRVLLAHEEHCFFSNLPRTLGARMRRAGFVDVQPTVLPQFNPVLSPDTYSFHQILLISAFVPGRRGVTAAEVAAWAQELRQLGERGQYFFCVNQYLFHAQKPR
jgi:arsenite methyltransferase